MAKKQAVVDHYAILSRRPPFEAAPSISVPVEAAISTVDAVVSDTAADDQKPEKTKSIPKDNK